jgi:hypothetical protein
MSSVRRIPLFAGDGAIRDWALVDDTWFENLNRWRWHLVDGYANRTAHVETWPEARAAGRSYRRTQALRMHRVILGLQPNDGQEVDHIDRNRLNNQWSNLRLATTALNRQNQPGRGVSAFRGVVFSKSRQKWQAQCMVDGAYHWLGYFDSEADAAEAAYVYRVAHMPFATA